MSDATSGIAMKGGGYYSLATAGAKDVIDGAAPLLLDALDRIPLDGPCFTMADFGCADGGTSLDAVARTLEAVRRRAPDLPLAMVYTDLPRNDFNALFAYLHGGGPGAQRLAAIPGLHVFASATSFYRPILPPGSLSLGFSATAMHWLSTKPCDITGHVQAVGATGAERAAFARQGRADWQAILLHRAAELRPGGRLVLVNFCRDEAGRYLGATGGVNMFDTFARLWRELLDAGAVTPAELQAMTLPQYYKDVAEFVAPLQDPDDPVHRAGLRLEHVETRVVRCPYAAAFAAHGDAERFARSYVPTLRSWTESTFFGALSPDRPEAERRALIDRYYARYEALVRERPEGHAMDYVHAYLVIAKS
ncbi:MAG: hypothetical protein U1E53_20820 [Dongiaceae bacterium]